MSNKLDQAITTLKPFSNLTAINKAVELLEQYKTEQTVNVIQNRTRVYSVDKRSVQLVDGMVDSINKHEMSREQAAELMGTTPQQIYSWIRKRNKNKLAYLRPGAKQMIEQFINVCK